MTIPDLLRRVREKADREYLPWEWIKERDNCKQSILTLCSCVEEMAKALELALSFAPKGPVPPGLDPTFYHTLNYDDEVILQKRIDEARGCLTAASKRLAEIVGDGVATLATSPSPLDRRKSEK